jgi:hypothetical protein
MLLTNIHHYLNGFFSLQKNKEKQVCNCYSVLNYDPPTSVGHIFHLALIKLKPIIVGALSSWGGGPQDFQFANIL